MGVEISTLTCEMCSNDTIQIPEVTTRSRMRSVKDSPRSPSPSFSTDSRSPISPSETSLISADDTYCQIDDVSSGGSKSAEFTETELTAPLPLDFEEAVKNDKQFLGANQDDNSFPGHITDEPPLNTFRVNSIATDILSVDDDDIQHGAEHLQRFHTMYNTVKLTQMSGDLFEDMCKTLEVKQKQLVSLNDWLEKKQSAIPYGWAKRWVALKDGYVLYSSWEITVKNDVDYTEIKRWSKCIDLGDEKTSVRSVKCKRKSKFKLQTKHREFIFKTSGKEQRDTWMKAIKQHIPYAQERRLFAM